MGRVLAKQAPDTQTNMNALGFCSPVPHKLGMSDDARSKAKVTLGYIVSSRPAYRRLCLKNKHHNEQASKNPRRGWGEAKPLYSHLQTDSTVQFPAH